MKSSLLAFADECGDTSVPSGNAEFPVFVVSVCVVQQESYNREVIPVINMLKNMFFCSEDVIFTSREIRRTTGAFANLSDPRKRDNFMNELGYFIKVLPITFVAYAIDKREVSSGASIGLYGFAIEKCVKKIAKQIRDNDLSEARLDLIIEARGGKEDRKLEAQIIRFMRKPEYKSINFKGAEFQLKSSNSIGLQLADLAAYPIASKVLWPDHQNRAYDIIMDKEGTDITVAKKIGLTNFGSPIED